MWRRVLLNAIFMAPFKPSSVVNSGDSIITNCKSGFPLFIHKSSVIRQKGESQNGCFKKTKHVKFFEKHTFFSPWYADVWVLRWGEEVKNVRFSENSTSFVFLKHAFWYSTFCLITNEVNKQVLLQLLLRQCYYHPKQRCACIFQHFINNIN